MSLDTNNQGYDAYGPGFRYSSDIPLAARRNKSGKATHTTTIKDSGEAGPIYVVTVEYEAKHVPALGTLDIEIGCVTDVHSVKLQWRENGKPGCVESAIDFNERLAARHCDYLLNCFPDIEDAICEEIRLALG